jgi:hypothetical protein
MEDAMKATGSRVWVLIAVIAVLWTGGVPIFSVPPGVKPKAVRGGHRPPSGAGRGVHAAGCECLARCAGAGCAPKYIRNYSIYLKE